MITNSECDAADLPQASAHDHPAEHCLEAFCPRCQHAVDAACPKCKSHLEPAGATSAQGATSELSRHEFYRRFVALVQNSRNAKFTLGCYLIATGDAYADGVGISEFGKAWGVGKATVSKHCRMICDLLGIPPSSYMRKEETRAKFRQSNRRPQKI